MTTKSKGESDKTRAWGAERGGDRFPTILFSFGHGRGRDGRRGGCLASQNWYLCSARTQRGHHEVLFQRETILNSLWILDFFFCIFPIYPFSTDGTAEPTFVHVWGLLRTSRTVSTSKTRQMRFFSSRSTTRSFLRCTFSFSLPWAVVFLAHRSDFRLNELFVLLFPALLWFEFACLFLLVVLFLCYFFQRSREWSDGVVREWDPSNGRVSWTSAAGLRWAHPPCPLWEPQLNSTSGHKVPHVVCKAVAQIRARGLGNRIIDCTCVLGSDAALAGYVLVIDRAPLCQRCDTKMHKKGKRSTRAVLDAQYVCFDLFCFFLFV